MVSKLGDHDVGQQPSGRDALVDDLRRNRCLDQRFAIIADPLPRTWRSTVNTPGV
jgi:hypothetical protein